MPTISGHQEVDTNLGGGDTLVLKSSTGETLIRLEAESGPFFAIQGVAAPVHVNGAEAKLSMGGSGTDGDIYLFRTDGDPNNNDTATVHVNGQGANLRMGGSGADGDIWLFPSNGDRTKAATATIHLDGQSGDIILQNADAAEDFDVADPESIGPGTVVVFDEASKLRQCERGYDKCVAGVISGAGNLRPGIILGRDRSRQNRLPVALIGKVFCKVDAQFDPIDLGDLLTTSPTLGHAMKATDPLRAFGTVIGKALQPLHEGKGMIPVLVALQ